MNNALDSLFKYIADRCVNCKHFKVHDDDIFMCDSDPDGCNFELQIYEPLHVKHCVDCLCFNKGNCVKIEKKVDSFTKPCEHFIYVRKSYPRKSS